VERPSSRSNSLRQHMMSFEARCYATPTGKSRPNWAVPVPAAAQQASGICASEATAAAVSLPVSA
jgi:hypothetical protein